MNKDRIVLFNFLARKCFGGLDVGILLYGLYLEGEGKSAFHDSEREVFDRVL